MKKTINILLVLGLLFFGLSCKKTKEKIDELTEFDMSYSYNLTIPSVSIAPTNTTVPVSFTTPDIATNSSTTFANHKTVSEKVSEIKLTNFKISTTGTNLDYLKSLTIYIQAAGLPETQLASKSIVPSGATSVDIDLSDTNIKNYLFGTAFKLRVDLTVNTTISSDQILKLDQTMHVKATLLN